MNVVIYFESQENEIGAQALCELLEHWRMTAIDNLQNAYLLHFPDEDFDVFEFLSNKGVFKGYEHRETSA